ncbi:MAG TPA: peptidoglycan editing factor PgeF [Gammaproteobacteria bacterium]|nr:peptidoglycan editing factor PgeF [Gammaproteobacteria bacterium]
MRVLSANWPAPSQVRALTTLRTGGVSSGVFSTLNLAAHVGDQREAVTNNRAELKRALCLPAEPSWLSQVHGCGVVDVSAGSVGTVADAAYTTAPGSVVAVMTADCIPLFLSDTDGSFVAIVHVGWRGLCAGVIEALLGKLALPLGRILAWTGPGIGSDGYQVRADVRETLIDAFPGHESALAATGNHWIADLPTMVEQRLRHQGVMHIFHSGQCTYRQADAYFSYRRDGQCGRMASLAWLE